jgi:hypothetical protein
MEVLKGIDGERAAHKPLDNVHSIWEITQHISAWEEVVLKRLQGDRTPVTASIGWDPVNKTSDAAWQRMQELLENRHIELELAVEKLTDDKLPRGSDCHPEEVHGGGGETGRGRGSAGRGETAHEGEAAGRGRALRRGERFGLASLLDVFVEQLDETSA